MLIRVDSYREIRLGHQIHDTGPQKEGGHPVRPLALLLTLVSEKDFGLGYRKWVTPLIGAP